MQLTVIDVWIEYNILVANLWFKQDDGGVVMFDVQRPIKIWEKMLDDEALTGLYLFELAMFYGGVMK